MLYESHAKTGSCNNVFFLNIKYLQLFPNKFKKKKNILPKNATNRCVRRHGVESYYTMTSTSKYIFF